MSRGVPVCEAVNKRVGLRGRDARGAWCTDEGISGVGICCVVCAGSLHSVKRSDLRCMLISCKSDFLQMFADSTQSQTAVQCAAQTRSQRAGHEYSACLQLGRWRSPIPVIFTHLLGLAARKLGSVVRTVECAFMLQRSTSRGGVGELGVLAPFL